MDPTPPPASTDNPDYAMQACNCLDENFSYLFDRENPLQGDWQGWAVQMLGGSTWNGVGTAVRDGLHLIFAVFIEMAAIISLVLAGPFGLCFESAAQLASLEMRTILLTLCTITLSAKSLIYQLIRAIPVIGYPLSQGITIASREFYALECVQNIRSSVDGFADQLGRDFRAWHQAMTGASHANA